MTKIYMAGPLFTWGEVEQNMRIAQELRSLGHSVFLPQETEQRELSALSIFNSDVAGCDWADACVACMDGPDPDSGTCWELGYMYGQGKPSVLYRTDLRAACGEGLGCMVNLMMAVPATKSLHLPYKSPREVAKAIHDALFDPAAA